MKQTVGTMTAVLVLAPFVLVIAGTPATAHWCESNTHEGCDGHDCDYDPFQPGPHDHTTVHRWWWDHWCKGANTDPSVFDGGDAGEIYGTTIVPGCSESDDYCIVDFE